MIPLENYYKKIIRYDLINRFFYTQLDDVPELKKIILNFGCKSFEIKKIVTSLFALELITGKQGTVTKSKQVNILLKIRKGHPVGCTVTLTKTEMYQFLFKLLVEIFPNLKDFKGINVSKRVGTKSFSFTIINLINFKELEKQFYLFSNLSPLNISLVTNTKTQEELLYLLSAFKIPLN